MTLESKRRSGLRIFTQLLLKGQRVDWRHSLVVVLVITGMFSTPLALGSIRNRVYVAVREQIEKENNAREITLHLARENAPPLDDQLIAEIEESFPGVQAVGNHKVVVSVEGPEGTDFLTLQTLVPGDPRQDPLQVTPEIPGDFGLDELVVSGALGRLLYGETWDSHWQSGAFAGPPLALSINDLPLSSEFQVVARRRLPGRGLYASPATGESLRRYTEGFGAPELGLPADPGLVVHALPKLAVSSCLLLLDPADPTCDDQARKRLLRRLGQLQHEVTIPSEPSLPPLPGRERLRVQLAEVVDEGGEAVRREVRGDCREALAPHLVETCGAALVLPELDLEVTMGLTSGGTMTIPVVAAGPETWDLLPGAEQLADLHGIPLPAEGGTVGLALPVRAGRAVGEEVTLELGDARVPARVERLYTCSPGAACAAFAEPMAVFRLQNLAEGLIEVSSRDPLVFVPVHTETEYDEVLAYVPRVEDLERVSGELRSRYPGYNVQYNVAALDKLRRQDSRLSTLFTLTISLSALFIVLALGALARINVERRRRQMAQMLILGFGRGFVRRLIVAEYVLLTAAAAAAAVGLTALLCAVARRLLSASDGGSEQGFEVIVQSMAVDPLAFLQVFAVVVVCTWTIAILSARKAARTDPLNLLD